MPFVEQHNHKKALRVLIALLLIAGSFYVFAIKRYNQASDHARDLHVAFANVEQVMQARYEYIESIFNKIRPTEQSNDLYTLIVTTRMKMFEPARSLDDRISDANEAERAVWQLHEYIRREPRTADMAPYAGLLMVERNVLDASVGFKEAYDKYRTFRESSLMSGISLELAGAAGELHEFIGPLLFMAKHRVSGNGRGDLEHPVQ